MGSNQMTPIGGAHNWAKGLMATGFNPAFNQKLPTLSGFQQNQSAFSPYDPAAKDGGYLPPSHSKNLSGHNSGLFDFGHPLPGQSHLMQTSLLPDLSFQSELFSKLKPQDMQYPSFSNLMGGGRDIMGPKLHRKDSFDHGNPEQDQAFDATARVDSFSLQNPLLPPKQKMQAINIMGSYGNNGGFGEL